MTSVPVTRPYYLSPPSVTASADVARKRSVGWRPTVKQLAGGRKKKREQSKKLKPGAVKVKKSRGLGAVIVGGGGLLG